MALSRILIPCCVFLLATCAKLPSEPGFDNPIIPGDPNYEPPLTTILSGPNEGAIIDSHSVSFTWTGNQPDMDYVYRLNGGGWSAWSSDSSIVFSLLDEGDYQFELKGRFSPGLEEDVPQSRFYSIDDIHGPALWLSPRSTVANLSSARSFEIILEEVANVMIAATTIAYDPTKLEVTQLD